MPSISVSAVNVPSITIQAQQTVDIVYTLSGTPSSGTLTCIWQNKGLYCVKALNIGSNATPAISLPQQNVNILSVVDLPSSLDHQGVIDNGSNRIAINIPYASGGNGNYEAYTSSWVENHVSKGELNDINRFRLTYPSGTFSSSGGVIPAVIEVDGDGIFNVRKVGVGVQTHIVSFPVKINGNTLGVIGLYALGGVPDRNFSDANHKFIYMPVVALDGNVWLNNNLGANYANLNHSQFNPTKQATASNDHHAYGSLFQWGRYSDGHELMNWSSSTSGTGSGTTTTNATSDTPGPQLVY